MSKNILLWPDVYKEQGHWLPTLKWAQDLNDVVEGGTHPYMVFYMGIADCKPIIDGYNKSDASTEEHFPFFNIFQNMYPKGYTTQSSSDPNERWKTWHIWAILYSQYASEEEVIAAGGKMPNAKLWEDAQSLRTAWTSANPNLLVSGYFTSLETLLLYWIHKNRTGRTDLDFVISTTYLRHPQDDPAIRARVNLQSFSKAELHKIVNMAVHGTISTDAPEMTLQEFVQPLESFNELIPCPKEYEYSHYKHGALVHYVDPCITKELSQSSAAKDSDGNLINWDEKVIKENIIFVTAGSQVLDYEDKAKNLFHSMCKAMQTSQLKDCYLIVAAGSKLVNSLEWKDYDKTKILIASWVPQRRLLSEGNIKCAIIHGGLATIKECVYFKRSFIINPLGKDQIDNALRLKNYGINNMLPMANVNPNTLLDAVTRVTSDYRMNAKLVKLGNVFVDMESRKEGLGIIQEVLKQQP